MKYNNNETRENRHNVENLKAIIKAEYYEQIELVKYGIQVYAAALTGEEYSVATIAEKTGGRYYFVTREGYRLPWSQMDPDTLAHACRDFMDQLESDEETTIETTAPVVESLGVETSENNVTTKKHLTAARVAEVVELLAETTATVFNSHYPVSDAAEDLKRFAKWQSIAADACDEFDPRAPFYFATRKQGAESGRREYVAERCRVLGLPVYTVRVERDTDENGDHLAGRYSLTIATDDRAAELLGLTPDTDPTDGAEVVSESETPQAETITPAPAADRLAEAAAKVGRALLTITRRAAGVLLLAVAAVLSLASVGAAATAARDLLGLTPDTWPGLFALMAIATTGGAVATLTTCRAAFVIIKAARLLPVYGCPTC